MTSVFSRRRTALAMFGCLAFAAVAWPAEAERPSGPNLLPKNTLVYARVADSRELVDDFMATSVGRLSQDEKIKPLIMHLYGSAAQAFSQVQEQIGLSLDQILAIPQGEIWFAVVGREAADPAFLAMVEVRDQIAAVRQLLERGKQAATNEGSTVRTEDFRGVTLTTISDDEEGGVTFCDREGVVLVGSATEVVKEVIERWTAGEAAKGSETLADNREFTAIMRRSVGTKDERPQVTWFVDPIAMFKNVSRDSGGAQLALAMFPSLGLDGIKAVGGSMIFNTEEFDSISHMHLALDNPRQGILEMLAMESGDTTPEDWVPYDAAAYMTVLWNTGQSRKSLRKMVDMIRGEGAFDRFVKSRMSDPLGINFEKDVLERIAGRFTYVSWMERPAKINSGTNLIGIKLTDANAFRKTLEGILEKTNANAAKKTHAGVSYYEFSIPARRNEGVDQSLMRLPTPSMAIVGDYLLVSDSAQCLQAAIASKADPSKSFAEELDFKLISSRIRQHLGSTRPGMITFQRPEVTMRTFYDLATAANTRQRLATAADTNQGFRALHSALEANPLPPFADIAKYLAPAGGMVVSDQSGIHYTAFSLKRD